MGQDYAVDKEIEKIDSLIQYSQFDLAQKKTDSLYNLLSKYKLQKKSKAQVLELQFRKALIIDRQKELPSESLKILIEIITQAEAEKLPSLVCRIYLLMALAYEKTDNLELTKKYLQSAHKTIEGHNLQKEYSTYCVRKGSYHRKSFEYDSVLYYANRAKEYAEKYSNETDLSDSYILLGSWASINNKLDESLKYKLLQLDHTKKMNDTTSISGVYDNVANAYLKKNDFSKALLYNDSSFLFYKDLPGLFKYTPSLTRNRIYETLGNTDSAYFYFKKYHEDLIKAQTEEEKIKTKALEAQFQNEKNEAVIKSKNRQMLIIGSLLAGIIFGSVVLFRKNREINLKNKVINRQVVDLSKALEQKQYLLSELQHRVKNNLQHVISILEIQKESVDFNNIDELIRGNQNRIHSMALLHKKLNISDNVNDVDFKQYVTELSELVIESYNNQKRNVKLNIKCELEEISIEKALPIGLIITELLSNSMKHAFKNRRIGIINLELTVDEQTKTNQFYYADNGDGFDFNKTSEKGLGQEIIKGLIDQLNGKYEAKNSNGFELIVQFKYSKN